MNKLERVATVGGLFLGVASIFISLNSNKIAQEANDLVKEQQSAHTLFLDARAIFAQISTSRETPPNELRASCLYRVELLNIGSQPDIIDHFRATFGLYENSVDLYVSESGSPMQLDLQASHLPDTPAEGVDTIALVILEAQIDDLNSYDWNTNPQGVKLPFSINPDETKEVYLLYTVTFSERRAYSWLDYQESNLLGDNEGAFPIQLEIATKPRFSNDIKETGSYCLSLDNPS